MESGINVSLEDVWCCSFSSEVIMLRMRYSVLLLSLGVLGGCAYQYGKTNCDELVGQYARMCQEYRQRKADAELRQETAELVKAYRICLQKYENDPEKAKTQCAVYTQALHEVEIKGLSTH
jgi:hypothetical protein